MSSQRDSSFVADEVLALRWKNGDKSAGDELIVRYARPLLAYLSRLSGSPIVAEELHQATWLSVLQHLERFDSRGSSGAFKAWLFRIATNKVHDVWRSRGRRKDVEDELRQVTPEEAPDASIGLVAGESADQLKAAIERLPESQRQVVQMRYYADMKFVEIAEALGCPLNTALGRMHKALLKLRELMSEGRTT